MTKINPRDLKPGQRVRVTFEAEVKATETFELRLALIGGHSIATYYRGADLDVMTCELLPEPIKVGDRVQTQDGDEGEVKAIFADVAWVLWDGCSAPLTTSIETFTRANASA